jgi:hypothetical protein
MIDVCSFLVLCKGVHHPRKWRIQAQERADNRHSHKWRVLPKHAIIQLKWWRLTNDTVMLEIPIFLSLGLLVLPHERRNYSHRISWAIHQIKCARSFKYYKLFLPSYSTIQYNKSLWLSYNKSLWFCYKANFSNFNRVYIYIYIYIYTNIYNTKFVSFNPPSNILIPHLFGIVDVSIYLVKVKKFGLVQNQSDLKFRT